MATARFKKIAIIGHKDEKKKIAEQIQKLGAIELIDAKSSGDLDSAPSGADRLKGLDLESFLGELQCYIDFSKGFEEKKSFLEKLSFKRPGLDFQKAKAAMEEFNWSLFCSRVKEIGQSKKELDIKTQRLIQERNEISPWIKLSIPLEDIGYTGYTLSHIGTVKKDNFQALKEELKKDISDLVIKEVDESKAHVFFYAVYLKASEEKASVIFKKYGFNYVYLTGFKGTAREVLEKIDGELTGIKEERANLLEKAKALLDKREKAFILYDYFSNLKKRESAEENFSYTAEAFIIEGWARSIDAGAIEREINSRFKNAHVIVSEPAKTDKIPVDLENKKVFQPFEFVTKIYGLPAYNEVDPTPFLAPFFFLFFGLCMSDAGYGLIICVLSWFALKRFRLGPQAQRFFKLFFYCGVSTIIIGILTGSWFGNIIDIMADKAGGAFLSIRGIKDRLVILDPQKEPMKLLIIALFLGVIQVWFGYLIAIYGNLKNKRFLDAALDQGSTLLFLFGFTGAILTFFGAVDKSFLPAFIKLLVFGSLCIILTQGRSNPGVGSKLFFGIYSLYNAFSGYISDILSYSRLWALGLVTGVMASTCNLMAFMIGGLVPYVGILFVVAILVFGHLITLLMNLLGAFVHPVRLQFVEFFSKFFRGGGRPFRPFRIETRYTIVE